jgi:hypothetical protein
MPDYIIKGPGTPFLAGTAANGSFAMAMRRNAKSSQALARSHSSATRVRVTYQQPYPDRGTHSDAPYTSTGPGS